MDLDPPSKAGAPPPVRPLPGPRRPLPGPSKENLRSGGRGLLIAGPVLLLLAAGIVLVGDWPFLSLKFRFSAVLSAIVGVASLVKGFVMIRRSRASADR